jgi:NAD(P) transhydrogenase subunit beta
VLLAASATLASMPGIPVGSLAAALVVGAAVGAAGARLVAMTAMPQLVAIFNGLGGGASALVASAEYLRLAPGAGATAGAVTTFLAGVIGTMTFSGSVLAAAKLQEMITGLPLTYPLQNASNLLVAVVMLGAGVWLAAEASASGALPAWYAVALALAAALGVLGVLPIGGADMPVVISLLNALSGLAAAAAGFALGNTVLVVSGALVGSSGIILTRIMCWAMDRSLFNVLFAAVGVQAPGAIAARPAKSITPDEAAILLGYARSVIVVPGYGLAVARAQHELRDVVDHLTRRGVTVKYAIHPVAGRMPGQMNVLLAEADIPYDQLYDLEVINPEFARCDVALVVGANDVVNPAARSDPQSPLYGMPILDADRATHVIVIKRSLSPGFAGVDNDLFYLDRTRMLFSDAREGLIRIKAELERL